MSDPFFSPDDASRTTSVSTYLQGRNHGTWLIAHQGVCDAANAAFAPTVAEPMAVATAIIRAVFSRVFISPPFEAATIRHLSKQAVKFTFIPDHLMELECSPAARASRQVDDPHDPGDGMSLVGDLARSRSARLTLTQSRHRGVNAFIVTC